MRHLISCIEDPGVELEIKTENDQTVVITVIIEGVEVETQVCLDSESLFDLLGSLHYFQKRIQK